MKRIYMTVALLGALVTGAFAQKTIDLSVIPYFPTPGGTFSNISAGDTVPLYAIVKNNGTDTVTTTDSITITFGNVAADHNGGFYELSNTYTGFSILPGHQDTTGITVIAGQFLGTSNTNDSVFVYFPKNSMDTLYTYVNGVDASGVPFTDAGFDGSVDETGNNISFWVFMLGSTTPINDVKLTKTALTVYPNPTQGSITVRNDFKAGAKTASLTISDISGRIVKIITLGQQTSGVKNFDVNVSDLNSGSYYIQLVTDQTRGVAKFTKN